MEITEFKEKVEREIGKPTMATYKNGNHFVAIFPDGTKIQEDIDPNSDHHTYDFPINFDIKINNRCDGGCPYCHENSTPNGMVVSLTDFANSKLFESLHPGTEMAIGGGNPFESPDLEDFLKAVKKKGIFANLTVNQRHLKKNFDLLKKFVDEKLVYGIGISLVKINPEDARLLFKLGDNVVIHLINGLFNFKDIMFLPMKKILILGYKDLRRGHDYLGTKSEEIEKNQKWLKGFLPNATKFFKSISFDCLALEQLDVKNTLKMAPEKWQELFQGDDTKVHDDEGNITCGTMYIDLPNMQVARMSTAPMDKRVKFSYDETIEDLFKKSIEGW